MAQKLTEEDSYDILVYAAHHNDFFKSRHIASPELAAEVLARFESLKDDFPKGIIVSLVSYLNYVVSDTLLEQGWKSERIEATDALRKDLPGIAAAAGFEFIDFADTVEESVEREGTIFSPFALYCDRAHLSPRGNRLLAEQMFETLRRMTD
jgi:lysophospholipase L1-like esterase